MFSLLMAVFLASLTISFTDVSDNEDGFHIYRAPVITGPFVLRTDILSTPAEKLATGRTVTFVDQNLPFSTQFCYRVTAFNATGESAPIQACATTSADPSPPPPTPTIIVPMPPVSLTVTIGP